MSILEFIDHAFSKDYRQARERFLAAAEREGATVTTYENPNKGPYGETLACDAAWVGPKDAKKVLVTISSTHGVEGFCGLRRTDRLVPVRRPPRVSTRTWPHCTFTR